METPSWIRKNINMVRVLSVPSSGWQSLFGNSQWKEIRRKWCTIYRWGERYDHMQRTLSTYAVSEKREAGHQLQEVRVVEADMCYMTDVCAKCQMSEKGL